MDIITAIANQLAKLYPDVPNIYRENREQGFKEPAFYIHNITGKAHGELNHYERREYLFNVVYFPEINREDVGMKEQCDRMRERLLDEFNRLDDLSLGLLGKEAKTETDTVRFTFKIRYRGIYQNNDAKIGTLEQRGGLKGGN